MRGARWVIAAAVALCCGAGLRAAVVTLRDAAGRIHYVRTPDDCAFVAPGRIGHRPRGVDPELWYAYDHIILQFCLKEGVDPVLAKAIIWSESSFNWRDTSSAKARGLMQVIDGTAKRMGHPRPGSYEPIENIRAGVKYIGFLQNLFEGNLIKTVAAYNAGEGNVTRYGGVPPFKETISYVTIVLKRWDKMTRGVA
jgi:hypothetical protein